MRHLKDKKIMIYDSVVSQNEYGAESEAWQPLTAYKLWAYYRHLSDSEINAAHTAGFNKSVTFEVNWRRDIKPGMHVVYDGGVYEIKEVDDYEGYKKGLKLDCEQLALVDLDEYPLDTNQK